MAISLLSFLLLLSLGNPNPSFAFPPDPDSDFSILTWHDYSPPSPPPPPPSPTPPYASCESDLGGSGDFDTLCEVLSSKELSSHIYIKGNGSLVLLAGISLTCPSPGCEIVANLSGYIKIGANSKIVAGRVVLASTNVSLSEGTVVDTTGLAGDPPARTSGVPTGTHGDGGGYGGRGASCYIRDGQTQEDSWGGDPYDWTSLEKPDSYGSQGGSTSVEHDYGGGGGGRVWIVAKEVLELEGMVNADGGDGGDKGGGGSGGSIYIVADKM